MTATVALIGFIVAGALHAEAWPVELVADTGAVAFGGIRHRPPRVPLRRRAMTVEGFPA